MTAQVLALILVRVAKQFISLVEAEIRKQDIRTAGQLPPVQ